MNDDNIKTKLGNTGRSKEHYEKKKKKKLKLEKFKLYTYNSFKKQYTYYLLT